VFSIFKFFSGGCGGSSPRSRNSSRFSSSSDSSSSSTSKGNQVKPEIQSRHPVLGRTLGRCPLGVASRSCFANLLWDIVAIWPNHHRRGDLSVRGTGSAFRTSRIIILCGGAHALTSSGLDYCRWWRLTFSPLAISAKAADPDVVQNTRKKFIDRHIVRVCCFGNFFLKPASKTIRKFTPANFSCLQQWHS